MGLVKSQRTGNHMTAPWLPIVAGVFVALVLMIASLVATAGVRISARGAIDQEVRENLSRLAAMMSSGIDADAHSRLVEAGQEQTGLYRSLNDPLTSAITQTEGVRFVYTLRGVGNDLFFVLDGTPIGDSDQDGIEDHSFLMDVYEDPDPAAWRALREQRITITENPYSDRWGTFLSGYAPIRLEDGSVDGVVGVDVSVDQYRARLARVDAAAAWALIPGIILSVLAGVGAWWMAGRLVRHAREIVKHRGEAVRANEAKSRLLANISHELRTPLNAIIGFAGLARDPRAGADERVDATDTIRHNAEHLLTLINDLLDISRAEAGAISIEPTRVDLHELIEQAVSPLRLHASEKRIGFDVEGLDGLPAIAVLDRTRVRQVLLNLLSNAVKFTDHGRVGLGVSVSNQVLIMRVRDTGPGMSAEEVGRLFRPFSQVGAHDKRMQGTGLGLAISRHLCELMGGSIRVESAPGEGSVFTASVPIGSAGCGDDKAERPRLQGAGCKPLDGRRVAIAEDGRDNMRLLRIILGRAGARAEGFPDGRRALDAVLDDPDGFDLLISDWDMPELSGEDLVHGLRSAGWTGPIISLTAHAMPEMARLCLGAGCDAHMAKPLDARKLVETCAELIQLHRSNKYAA